jgi:hypothetical protein
MKTSSEGVTPIYFIFIRSQGNLFFVDVYADLVVVEEMER